MISTVTYNGDGSTRVFPVGFEIKGEDYVVIYINNIAISDRTTYDIINNSIVFNIGNEPILGTDNVQIVVASSPNEIGDLNAPPSNIQTVLNNLVNINVVASNETNINTVGSNITNVNAVGSNIANVNTTATNIADINNVVTQVIPNLSEILLADDNATIATNKALEAFNSTTTATNKALEASGSATIATTKALEASGSATIATNKALEASNSATTATTKAGEALTSANNAYDSEVQAGIYAAQAQESASSVSPENYVHKTGNETIADIKTFSSSPVVPTPTTNFQVATKKYVDDKTLIQPNDSRVKTALNATGGAPIYACRAWVNFNGTGTVAIRASGNVSSIIDGGVGIYTVNFTTAMIDVNYETQVTSNATITTGNEGSFGMLSGATAPTTNNVQVKTILGGSFADREYVMVSIHR